MSSYSSLCFSKFAFSTTGTGWGSYLGLGLLDHRRPASHQVCDPVDPLPDLEEVVVVVVVVAAAAGNVADAAVVA